MRSTRAACVEREEGEGRDERNEKVVIFLSFSLEIKEDFEGVLRTPGTVCKEGELRRQGVKNDAQRAPFSGVRCPVAQSRKLPL